MIVLWLAALAVHACLTAASSTSRNPLQLLAVAEHPSIRTPKHRVHAHTTFDLTLDLYHRLRRVRLALEPNHDIIPDGATISYMSPDGTIRHQDPILRSEHKVYKGWAWLQAGDDAWHQVGWARINVLRDGIDPLFEGAFSVNNDHHHIQLSSKYMTNRHSQDPLIELTDDDYMVVWRDSDIQPDVGLPEVGATMEAKRGDDDVACASDDLDFNTRPDHPVYQNILKRESGTWGVMPVGNLFGKRQIDTQSGSGTSAGVNLVSTIGQSSGCPNTRKVALVGVATDCTYTGTFNSSETARSNVITQINSASSLWENSFNISLGLQNLTVSDSNCPGTPSPATQWNQPCSGSVEIQARLNMFSSWRGTLGDSNSHWTLLTNCNTGSAVGLAWLGQACVHEAQTSNGTGGSGPETVTGANVVAKTPTEWQVISHETGHTYGAVHDCTSQTCSQPNVVNSQQCCPLSAQTCDAGEQYIMNPSTTNGITHFSPCSIGNICSGIGRNAINTTCLSANLGISTITGQECGNGIVEAGEDCDCGGEASCGDDPCCDAKTCKFKNDAVCDDANEDCCQHCQFSPAGTVCRPSTGSCDPQETCSGTAGVCPPDTFAKDGSQCSIPTNSSTAGLNTGNLACASGQCTSRDLQCRTVMGAYTGGNNNTYACDQISCTMSCASPAFGPNTCYGLQQNLLDGTGCGGGGFCRNGQCQGSSTAKEVGSWIDSHRGLVIGIAAAVGGIILLSLLSCIISCCRKGRRSAPPPPKNQGLGPGGSWYAPGAMGPRSAPQRATPGDVPGGWRPPPPPVPMHQQGLYGGGIIGAPNGWGQPSPPMHGGGWGGPPRGPQPTRYA